MSTRINKTKDGVKTYPLHTHNHYEIMLYVEGNGEMLTQKGNFSFSVGTIIIVPPKIEHGSVSKNGFKNISIGGDFESFFTFEEPVVLFDTPSNEGRTLASLIYDNRFRSDEYLEVLISAYLHFLLKYIKVNKHSENFKPFRRQRIKFSFTTSKKWLRRRLRKSTIQRTNRKNA